MKQIFIILAANLYALGAMCLPDSIHNIHSNPPLAELKANTDSLLAPVTNIHFQANYIYQYKPAFSSPYAGANSLTGNSEAVNSITLTVFYGIKLWKGGEFYINPEIAGGSGLSGAYGLAASTNGETFRVGSPSPTLYLARAFFRQTFPLCSSDSALEDGCNQLSCHIPLQYLQVIAGKFSLSDIFDNNNVSNSPRTQFINWALMNNAAWDYAANVRGYTYSMATILQLNKIAYKFALAALPYTANGASLNTNITEVYSLNGEIDKSFTVIHQPLNLRLLIYNNTANMGLYSQAISLAVNHEVPDIINSRQTGRRKTGFGLNWDYQLNSEIGIMGRVGINDGKTETWCYTESDQTASAGITFDGIAWDRKNDCLGIAIVTDGLSAEHRKYLGDGGMGFELGDGKLDYGLETVTEWYYSYKPGNKGLWITGDYQFVVNPGDNMARGPVNVFSIRLHAEL